MFRAYKDVNADIEIPKVTSDAIAAYLSPLNAHVEDKKKHLQEECFFLFALLPTMTIIMSWAFTCIDDIH